MKEVKVRIIVPTKTLLDWCIGDFWDHFEECWNAKSGIGEEYGILKDCGLTGNAEDYIDVKEITVVVTAFYEDAEEELPDSEHERIHDSMEIHKKAEKE